MKGNVIVGQSGGPTAVINASLAGVFEGAKKAGFNKIYGMQFGVQGLLNEKVVDLAQKLKSVMDIELLKRTPSSYLGSCRYKLPSFASDPKVYEQLFAVLEKLDVSVFIYIGGNDSMDTISKLSEYADKVKSDIKFIGVPKTIDNDLVGTDHTPGFGSAAKYIATVLKEIVRDSNVYDLHSVTVVEIMGRNAGWLTGAAALCKADDCEGVDMICLPEVDFNLKWFLSRVKQLHETKNNIVIAVSEGVKQADGRYLCEMSSQSLSTDVFGHINLTGTAQYLSTEIQRNLGCKSRAIELNTIQRCGSHIASRVDVTEAFQVGIAAVQAAVLGESAKMVALKRVSLNPCVCVTELLNIHEVANKEKLVPAQWIDTKNGTVTSEFIEYLRGLIQAELTPIYVDGLPCHLVIKE